MRKLNIEVYLQPAGFEDGVITKWKVEKQAQRHFVTIAIRDLFGGGLAETTKQTQMVCNQTPSNIAGKMGCALQITDTDIAMRLKSRSAKELANLRVELIKLASQLEIRDSHIQVDAPFCAIPSINASAEGSVHIFQFDIG